nr:MAG TPA: hypothetical protein [Caudoviricetes sp.]
MILLVNPVLHYGSTTKQPKPVSGEITLAATER